MEIEKVFHCSDKEFGVNIPYKESVGELSSIIASQCNIHSYSFKDVSDKLHSFITNSNSTYYDDRVVQLLESTKSNGKNSEDVAKEWEKLMRKEMAEHGERRCASDEELFSIAYHKLVHSPALDTMLQLEYMYALTVRQRADENDVQIANLSERQSEEMNSAVEQLEEGVTESNINDLAVRHFEDQTLLQVQLTSELDTIKEAQRREYRDWIMQTLEQNQTNCYYTPKGSPLVPVAPPIVMNGGQISQVLEESFTIHLGSQLKQMHNIRVLAANVMDLCGMAATATAPQLLQTTLALYSNDLCGLVLMTDNVIGSRMAKDFLKICHRSTEFHFSPVNDQLEGVSDIIKSDMSRAKNSMQLGDFYVTRHSNLSQVHIIFHMVSDDMLRMTDINSRHSVVLGLRNILKTACSNDITSLTIPLLLQYEMTEEMTVSWCIKRAELVFKCVKGFMIEMASWGGSDLKTLQFLLPEDISPDVFQSLTAMLPSIFKVSNPLILKTAP